MTAEDATTTGAAASRSPLAVVLDTNILLSLFVFRDSRLAALRRALDSGCWAAITDERCLAEYRRVLGYAMFHLDAAAQASAFAEYERLAAPVGPPPPARAPLPQCRDGDDQKFLELARDGGAALLVTADKALLRLSRRGQLRQLFRIVTPDAALELLAQDSAIFAAEN